MTNSKRRSHNWFSYKQKDLPPMDPEINKSETIPGQSVSLRELLDKHSRGMALPQPVEGQYFGDLEVPDFEEMDLVDLMEYTKDLKGTIEQMQSDLQKAAEAQEKRAQEPQEPQPEPKKEAKPEPKKED